MKRTLLISIVGFLILIIASILVQYYLKNSSEELIDKIKILRIHVIEKKIDECVVLKEEIKEEWEKTKKVWSALIDHQELDNIEELVRRIEILVGEEEEEAELLSELNELRFYIEHVPIREEFALENIL
jgi:hypothetical protein